MKSLPKFLTIAFFALLAFTSCQTEVIEETPVNELEAFEADSELASLMRFTSTFDGSFDNIIDNSSELSVILPVTVVANGTQLIIESAEDYSRIEAIFDEHEDDDDRLEIVFPITVTTSDHSQIVINNQDELDEYHTDDNSEDDDIECIDFVYPFTVSVFNSNFQIINTVTINSDEQLHQFIRHLEAGVLASINYPIEMVLFDGTVVVVHNNFELIQAIREARNACDEDDDNDHNDDDFTIERLNNLLISCPWIVHDLRRNNISLTNDYREYVMVFKEDGTVKVRARNGDMLTGTWTTRITDRGAKITLHFDSLVDFTLEWFVYEIEHGKIKLYTEGGNRIILKKNCSIVVDQTIERIENILKECFWRVARLHVNGSDNEGEYIGTPLKFFENGVVKIRVNGEYISGTWDVIAYNVGYVLQINLEGRPDLHLQWLITFLEEDLIKLENANSRMVLKQHCPDVDEDVKYINNVLNEGLWDVALYQDGNVNETQNYFQYVTDFLENGWVKVVDPNNGIIDGSWLVYRDDDGTLKLGLNFGLEPPFDEFNFRWKIVEVSADRIYLKDFSSTGTVERILVFEKH